MSNVLVDPAILMTPDEHASFDEISSWVDCLDKWLMEALTSPRHWLHDLQATCCLDAQERFPSFQLLQALARQHALSVDIRRIMRHVHEFFRNDEFDLIRAFESRGYLVEVDDSLTVLDPDAIETRWLPELRPVMLRTFGIAVACKVAGDELACGLHVATAPIGDDNQRYLAVSTTVSACVPDMVPENSSVSSVLPLVYTPRDIPRVEVAQILVNDDSICGDNIRYAIQDSIRRDWCTFENKAVPFSLGSHFVSSLSGGGPINSEVVMTKIIRLAAAVVVGQAQAVNCNVRHLRRDAGANSPQRTRARDGAKGWRLTITSDGAGWRMHYWELVDSRGQSSIEFSNVLRKNQPETIFED